MHSLFSLSLFQLTAQQSASESAPLERQDADNGNNEIHPQENTADINSLHELTPLQPTRPSNGEGDLLLNGNGIHKPSSPVPSLLASPCTPPSPRSPVLMNGCHTPPSSARRDASEPKESNQRFMEEENGSNRNGSPTPSSPAPSRRHSRIPVLESFSLLDPPPGSAKEKLLQKRVHHLPISPSASPSLSSERRVIVAAMQRDQLSSASSERSQDDESLLGSRSDRQGDDALSLSSSSSPLLRKSKIPRPVTPTSGPETVTAHYLPRPPPGKPPNRPTLDGR